uniref:S-locus F-box protein type-6 n=1 Tax=Solanum pennellii TaxID=28526 RepID=A0A075TS65_SOLPN|nr:S-locus F-box protein type-6 [Solanum pennellii]
MVDGIMKKYPEDMIIYILLRLPLKFILRFKCVSKTFYTLIQSSYFINIHYNHTLTSTYDNILLKRSCKEDIERYKAVFSFISSDYEDNLNPVYPDLDVPNLLRTTSVTSDKLIDSNHGLIALMEHQTTILFNISNRNYRHLPPSPFQIPKGFYQSIKSGGFGYDSVVNDFKVFRISEVYTEDRYGYPEDGETEVEVYELGIDIWRKLDHVNQELPILFWLNSSMSYKGAYHWISSVEGRNIILCFDMTTEIFRNIELPNTSKFLKGTLYSLQLLNESLSLLCYPCLASGTDPTTDMMEIWIMKDYNIYESWIRKYTIIGLPTENPLVVWKDYILLFQSNSGYLISYDLKQDEIKELNILGCQKSIRAINYKEFLTPIQRQS